MDLIKKLLKAADFWEVANSLNEDQLAEVIRTAADYYYNKKESLISDKIYDALIDRLKAINPNHEVLGEIGAPVKGNKVKLPYWLGSMDKIKGDEKALKSWLKKYDGPYIISDKLDGMSCLLMFNNGKFQMFSRGGKDGYGKDITHLLDNMPLDLSGIKKAGKKHDPIAIRGELIMSKKVFAKHYAKKNPNARNLVGGIMNSKETSVDPNDVKRLEFVTYEIIKPNYLPSEQLDVLESWGMSVVPNETYDKLSLKTLDKVLEERKKKSEYEIDGLIIMDNNKHKRPDSGNPDYAFAYKGMTETAEVEVTQIHWAPSKDGRIIPRIEFEPVKLSGAKLTYATGFNAKFVVDNKLGKGAIIEVVRSGDVIPYVLEIIKQAKKPELPDRDELDYEWDDNKVHIVLKNAELNETVITKVITRFLKTLEVDNLSEGLVARLVSAGHDNIIKIVRLKKKDFLELEGFKEKLSEKLFTNLQNALKNVDVLKLMVGSNVFGTGFGNRKLVKVLETYPKIVDQFKPKDHKSWLEKLDAMEGWDTITSKAFLEQLPLFQEFYRKISKYITIKPFKTTKSSEGSFKDQKIVFTGFRNPSWQKKIESQGGKVSGSVSGNTTLLVYAESDKGQGLKYKAAVKKGIKVISESNFKKIIEA